METKKWTKKILEAAVLEITSRKHPLDGRVKEGIPREAIIARLESETDHLKRHYATLETRSRIAEGQVKTEEKKWADLNRDAKAEMLKELPTLKSLKKKKTGEG
jgi:hypothetical protein